MRLIVLALFLLTFAAPARAESDPEWFTCAAPDDCTAVKGACGPAAVNKKATEPAIKYYAELAPRVECDAPSADQMKAIATCVKTVCMMAQPEDPKAEAKTDDKSIDASADPGFTDTK